MPAAYLFACLVGLSLLASLAFAVAVQGGLTRAAGLFLALYLAVALTLMIRWALRSRPAPENGAQELDAEVADLLSTESAGARPGSPLLALAGLIGTSSAPRPWCGARLASPMPTPHRRVSSAPLWRPSAPRCRS